MNITFKASKVRLTADVRAYVSKRMQDCVRLLTPSDSEPLCEVELSKETAHKTGLIFRAEANLTVGGRVFRAEARGESLEAAIDEVKQELQQELRSFKERRKAAAKKGGARLKAMLRRG